MFFIFHKIQNTRKIQRKCETDSWESGIPDDYNLTCINYYSDFYTSGYFEMFYWLD